MAALVLLALAACARLTLAQDAPEVVADEKSLTLHAADGGSVFVSVGGAASVDLVALRGDLEAYCDDKIVQQQQQIDALLGKVSDLTDELAQAKSDLQDARTRLTTVEGSLSTARTDIDDIKGDVSKTMSDMTTAEGSIGDLATRLTTVEGKVSTAESDIDSVETRVGTVEGELDTAESEIGDVEADVADLSDKVGANTNSIQTAKTDLGDDISDVSSKVTALTSRVSTVEGNNANVAKLVQDHMNKLEFIGRFDVDCDYSGTGSSSWWTISHNGVGFAFGDYNQQRQDKLTGKTKKLYIRQCMTYTDSGSNDDRVVLRIRKKDSSQLRSDAFSTTWSSSGLVRHECGGWFDASVLSVCGYGWGSTCQIQAIMDRGRFSLHIIEYFLEMAVQATT